MTTSEQGAWLDELLCPSCGQHVAGGELACPSCGRAVAAHRVSARAEAASTATVQDATSHSDAPTLATHRWPTSAEMPTARWDSVLAMAPPVGMAALATVAVTRRSARPGARRGFLASVAAVCLLALLAGGFYWVYASLYPTPSQTALARYFPDSTLAYASVDLQAASQSGHSANLQSVLAGTPVLNGVGLDWASDVQPWAGPTIALGIFASLPQATASPAQSITALSALGITVVLQSRDDNAAQAAIRKALSHQQRGGTTYTTTTYGGFTLYSATPGHSTAGVLAVGRGVVLMATSDAAARTAIDRAGGTGISLSGESSFQRAVGTLPQKRFGTLYYNVRSLTDPTGLGATILKLPFVNTYPTGVGALQWTSTGMRWQLTLTLATNSTPRTNLSGDTTSLASLVPADAAAYIGVANLGTLNSELSTLLASAQTTQRPADLLQSMFGVPTAAPSMQVPAALFIEAPIAGSGAGRTGVLLREPSAQAADALMTAIAAQQHWSRQDTTVAGVAAASYAATPGSASPSSSTQPLPGAVEAYFNGVMFIASTSAGLAHILGVAQGHGVSLAQAATFRQLVAAAPINPAATVYRPAGALGGPFGAVHTATSLSTASAAPSLGTLTWTSGSMQLTYDVTMP